MSLTALQPDPEFQEPSVPDDDEPQGCILRVVELPDGSIEEQPLPLTLERLLHPEEGDKVTQTDFHISLLISVVGRLRRRLEQIPGVGVFSDLLFDWNRLGLKNSSPDVAVVKGLPASRQEISEQIGGTFKTAVWGVRPHLVIEVVSPEHGQLRSKDLEANVDIYARAGIEEYLIFNPVRLGSTEPLQLLGYRLAGGRRYAKIQPDPQGRILSQTTGLYFWSDPDARRIEIFDQATGQRLMTAEEEADLAEAARRSEAAARKGVEAQLAEKAAALEAAKREIARLKERYEGRD